MNLDDAGRMATALMAEHGLTGWRLVFDSAKTRAGVCRPQREQIGLSRHLTALHAEAEVRDTVLHEIAHALVGPAHGHDEVWRATAARIGCSGRRCVSQDAPRVEGDWVGVCPAGHRRTAHRRPERVGSCALCSPGFDPNAVYEWTHRGRPAQMHPNYVAELLRLRSKGSSGVEGSAPRTPRVGDRVRLRGSGKYRDLPGHIESRGRTRYTVRTELGLVTAPFALVEVVDT